MATHENINRARDDDDYTVHEASRYVSQEDHRGGFKAYVSEEILNWHWENSVDLLKMFGIPQKQMTVLLDIKTDWKRMSLYK